MASLARDLRRELERTVIKARRVGEEGARKALESLAVGNEKPWPGMTDAQKNLRVRLRAHGRQLGDREGTKRDTQTIEHLVQECAYENWHRMLFARFLAENNLLIEPESKVSISLDECRELAMERGTDWLALASEFAVGMLPQIFRKGDPVLEVALPPETRHELEGLLKALPGEVFAADDSLGWVYQFWQTERRDEVNESGDKIGADQLAAVTQLFTEDYMVLFLLHNTLGAWWTAKRKAGGNDPALPGYEWTYLRLKENGTPAAGSFDGWPRAARDLKVLDPCMGSGHFLVFAFPILVGFRMEEEGLSRELAVGAVLRDNLFGLELDNRCTQIAAFNLALTAWRMVGGFRELPQLNLACSGLGINAKEEEWVKMARKDDRLRETMKELYRLFEQASALGSLINPKHAASPLFRAEFEKVYPLLVRALSAEQYDELGNELAVAGQGVVRAAHLLAHNFTLVVTNVPYLGRGKQDDILKHYCDRYHPASKADLATCFLERCVGFCEAGGTVSAVAKQDWLYLDAYKPFRRNILTDTSWAMAARLGPRAFESISGEVVNVMLLSINNKHPLPTSLICCLDVSDEAGPADKSISLRNKPILEIAQSAQLQNPDARIVFASFTGKRLLREIADASHGQGSFDSPRFSTTFWEVASIGDGWVAQQSTPAKLQLFGGCHFLFRWEDGEGGLAEMMEAKERQGYTSGKWKAGVTQWGKRGVLVGQMGDFPSTLYLGAAFDENASVIIPSNAEDVPALWCFASSPEFRISLRSIDQSIKITCKTLVKVPFDLLKWREIAAHQFPTGLPAPTSDDPSQWLFDGHPKHTEQSLHVALIRLLGYRWPRQTGSNFIDCPAVRPDGLEKHADSDGIVCLNPVKGEISASDRLRALLADVHGVDWSASKQSELLSEVGYGGKNLEDWLRDGFFEQHGEIFWQRPFVWHLWDGLRDGFHALVNCHKLAAPNGEGRQTLEKLIYTYLGDWIDRQRADQKNGIEGADARVAAAVHLQSELKKILTGDPPYDIFVRWKPLHEQPIGWEPDINDGVRINIRPFMTAKVLNGRGKSACILRTTPKIKWDKDRGNEPSREKEDFPWFWSWDESAVDFAGGKKFDGNRWNDLHYTPTFKQAARGRHAADKERKKK